MPVHGEFPVKQTGAPPQPPPLAGIVDPKPQVPAPVPVAPPPPPVDQVLKTVGAVTLVKAFLGQFHPITAIIVVTMTLLFIALAARLFVGKVFRLKS